MVSVSSVHTAEVRATRAARDGGAAAPVPEVESAPVRESDGGPGSRRLLRGTVLAVDDEPTSLRLLGRLLRHGGHTVVTATDGESALAAVERHHPDVILLDVVLPGLDGFEVCRRVKNTEATRLTPVVLVTGLSSAVDRVRGIEAGADEFLSKPFDVCELEARVQSLLKLKRYTDELESVESVIMSLALTVEARDAYTEGHCRRLAAYAVEVGRALGLDDTTLAALGKGGHLHDVGKIAIPDTVLLKPGPLTEAELAIVRRHTVIGEQLCGTLRSLVAVRPIVRSHHERLDGTGYPDGLRGDSIPLSAQIVSIVDAYDAITTARPYHAARPADAACAELASEAARGALNRRVVSTVIDLVGRGRFAAIASAVRSGSTACAAGPHHAAPRAIHERLTSTRG